MNLFKIQIKIKRYEICSRAHAYQQLNNNSLDKHMVPDCDRLQ